MPIIFITAYGDVPKSVQATEAGALEFLTKPLHNDALMGAIRSALKAHRGQVIQMMKVNSLADLVRMAAQLGHVHPGIQAAAAGNRVEGPCCPSEIAHSVP